MNTCAVAVVVAVLRPPFPVPAGPQSRTGHSSRLLVLRRRPPGTRIEIKLPLAEPPPDAIAALIRHNSARASLASHVSPLPPRLNVLIVDDNQEVRASLRRVLNRAASGWSFQQAATGEAALARPAHYAAQTNTQLTFSTRFFYSRESTHPRAYANAHEPRRSSAQPHVHSQHETHQWCRAVLCFATTRGSCAQAPNNGVRSSTETPLLASALGAGSRMASGTTSSRWTISWARRAARCLATRPAWLMPHSCTA